MSTKLIDYILFYSLLLITLAPPIYFWIKWIIEAKKNKKRFGRVASILSLALFISGFSISWFGPQDPFINNTIIPTLTGVFSILAHILAFSIIVVYFLSKWIYNAIQRIKS